MKIALVEDDEFLVNMYNTKLSKVGMDVAIAQTGDEAFEVIKKEKPEVILLDILLPGKDGFEVLKELKGNDDTKNIPVIMLSNLGQKADIDKGMALGATDYLIKAHFTPSEVVEKIKAVVK